MSHLGDVVCALPLFHALRQAFPEAGMGWVLQEEFAGLIEGLPGLQRVFRFRRRGGLRAWLELRRELRAFAPDLAVDAQGNLKSAAALWCSAAKRRVGLHPSEWRERFGARALTEAAPPSGAAHGLERVLALARYVAPVDGAPRCDPALSAGELAQGREELERLLGGSTDGVLILHLAPARDIRAWPPASFEALARDESERRPVLLVSGPAEEDVGLELARRLADGGARRWPIAHWIGQRDLRQLAAVFTAAADRGGAFVGGDSGPMHLACASGLRVFCLEGPMDGARTGPWSAAGAQPDAVVRAASGPDCAPCLARRCSHAEGPVCLTRLGVAEVSAALAAD